MPSGQAAPRGVRGLTKTDSWAIQPAVANPQLWDEESQNLPFGHIAQMILLYVVTKVGEVCKPQVSDLLSWQNPGAREDRKVM